MNCHEHKTTIWISSIGYIINITGLERISKKNWMSFFNP